MNDQATTLRSIATSSLTPKAGSWKGEMQLEQTAKTLNQSRFIAVTGGKGGVGKSNLSVNLAIELGALNKKTALMDADYGLANADLLCGITPKFHLGHVIKGLKDLEDIIVEVAENVSLIPSGSGFEELANMSLATNQYLVAKLQAMEKDLDFILIDTAAGIAENVAGVVISAEEAIIVVTPEPTSVVDAYATIKLILRHAPDKPISIVVNSVVGVGDAEKVFRQIHSAVNGFLGHEVEFLGMIPRDGKVVEAVCRQIPVVQYAPESPSSRAIRLIAKELSKSERKQFSSPGDARSFWELLARH